MKKKPCLNSGCGLEILERFQKAQYLTLGLKAACPGRCLESVAAEGDAGIPVS